MPNKKDKKCLVFETLGKLNDLTITESQDKSKGIRLSGLFGQTGVVNANNRIYDKKNYNQMVESMQKEISENGVLGELEHPNSFNINLNNVSHKIESIQMNEDGTVTGTILLLNTDKGRQAQAIVEAGVPLFISSRGAGTITNEGKVTLTGLKTYDLVGTPGFSNAKFTLAENKSLKSLNESLTNGDTVSFDGLDNNTYIVITESEDDEDDDKDNKDKDKKPKDKSKEFTADDEPSDDKPEKDNKSEDDEPDNDNKSADDKPDDDKSEDDKPEKDDKSADEPDKDDKPEKDDKSEDDEPDKDDKKDTEKTKKDKNKDNNTDMDEMKKSIDQLTEKINSLEAELHVAKESKVDYNSIEKWVTEEFGKDLENRLERNINIKIDNVTESIAKGVQAWVCEEFAPQVQSWITEEFAPEVQNWVCEEFAPEVQNWVCEEFAPEVQGWITEEFAPEIQGWITEEYSPTIQGWITEEYSPVIDKWVSEEFGKTLENKVNENVSAYLAESKASKLNDIDSLLDSLSENKDNSQVLNNIIKEANTSDRFKGMIVVEGMPSQYKPLFEGLSDEDQDAIIRTSRAYDFTKAGVMENFWANVNFDKKEEKPINEEKSDPMTQYYNNVYTQMQRLRQK